MSHTATSRATLISLSALFGACASTTIQPVSAPSETQLTSAAVPTEAQTRPGDGARAEAATVKTELPSKCDISTDPKLCLPPAAFARALCAGEYADVALAMFSKGAPWTRAFTVHDVHAWNVTSARSHRSKLTRDEEVLVLAKHEANQAGGMMIVNAQPTFDALRWDGTCVSLDGSELTLRRPASPKSAPLVWSHLGGESRHALLAMPKIRAAEITRNRTCGSPDKTAAAKCDAADRNFGMSIVDAIRQGAAMPTPIAPASAP